MFTYTQHLGGVVSHLAPFAFRSVREHVPMRAGQSLGISKVSVVGTCSYRLIVNNAYAAIVP